MVSVQLIGGLGNQMFQIAACIAYALENNLPYHIPLKTQNSHQATPYFKTLTNPDWDSSLPEIIYEEPNFHYDKIPEGLHKEGHNLILKGYFQSYRYFEGVFDRRLCRLFYYDLSDGKRHLPILNNDKIAVHIRNGDYKLYPDKHPIISVDYIGAALNSLKENYRIEDTHIFSDEPQWCAQMAAVRDMSCMVVFEKDPIKSFLKLMSYQHLVLSNSTFGYWAAMMRNKLFVHRGSVIYPDQWFGPSYSHYNTKDICPPDWIKI